MADNSTENQVGTESQSESAPKTKKVNRLSVSNLSQKISEFESNNQIHSKYYKHLVERKKQLES